MLDTKSQLVIIGGGIHSNGRSHMQDIFTFRSHILAARSTVPNIGVSVDAGQFTVNTVEYIKGGSIVTAISGAMTAPATIEFLKSLTD